MMQPKVLLPIWKILQKNKLKGVNGQDDACSLIK
jgi:hypothetical protein